MKPCANCGAVACPDQNLCPDCLLTETEDKDSFDPFTDEDQFDDEENNEYFRNIEYADFFER